MAELDSDTVKKVGYVYMIGLVIVKFNSVTSNSVVSLTPPSTYSDPPVPSVDLSNIPDDGTLGESRSNLFDFSIILYHCRYPVSSCCTACSPEKHCVSMV